MSSESILERYRRVTTEALAVARAAPVLDPRAAEVLDMASRYVSDAEYFFARGDADRALAALSYAHGWLDCGARLQLFAVTDNVLFTVDGPDEKS